MKKYSDIFPSLSHDVDAEVIVIGAGIGGASVAHYTSKMDQECRVMVLEQFNYSTSIPQTINRGSSRGGPRRIGTIGGDERTRNAWKAWQQMNNDANNDHLLDNTGEIYVLKLFPYGWLLMGMFAIYYGIFQRENKPNGFQLLWTSRQIEKKLGRRQGFKSSCWSWCVGVYHKEAAALHTDAILKHLLKESDNLQVRYGTRVTNIELLPVENGSKLVKLTVVKNDSSGTSTLRCRHLVIAAGGWTGDLLKCLYRNQKEYSSAVDPDKIQTKIEVFTCPVYQVEKRNELPPPFSLASDCPLFSCISKKVYGFPINHSKRNPMYLSLRPFYKAFDSDDPDDQRVSQEQKSSVQDFVDECLVDNNDDAAVSYSHCYTCRYPKLSVNGGKSYKPLLDFLPESNNQIVVLAGLDGYGFKFGSIYGMEFLELLDSKKAPKGMEWPAEKESGNFIGRMLRAGFVRLMTMVFTAPKQNEKKEE